MVLPEPDDPRRPAVGVLPPWLWFWLLTYFLGLPNLIALVRLSIDSLLQYRSLPPQLSGSRLESLLGLASIAELVPAVAVAAGVAGVFLPWIRAASLERRFALTDPEPQVGGVDEIAAFVRRFAPGIGLKVNLLRTDQLAFVYPTGPRRATIALFGGILRLWRGDRTAAEAVLLHEIGHLRHGDVLVVGVGSLFEAVVKRWMLIVLVSFLLPTIASDTTGSSEALLRAMDRLAVRTGWWRWLLLRMSHPPNWLRRFAVRHGDRSATIGALLLLYPLAYLARLIVLLAYTTINLFVAGASAGHVADVLTRGIRTYTGTITPVWTASAFCVLVWPLLAPGWERFFGSLPGAHQVNRWAVYGAAAFSLMVLLGIGPLIS